MANSSISQPLKSLPIVEHWDCHACGGCCKAHTVLLTDEDVRRLAEQRWQDRPEYRQTKTVVRTGGWYGPRILNQRADGSCVFLQDDGRCRIHAEFGEAAKPWACRIYPFELIPVNGQIRVSMRRNCPSAAAGKGRPVSAHFAYLKQFIDKALPNGTVVAPPAVARGRPKDWKDVRKVLDAVERIVLNREVPLVRRLVHAGRLTEALAALHADGLSGKAVDESIEVFESAIAGDMSSAFRERQPPSAPGGTLFRQIAAEYSRHHPNFGNRPGWRERWRLFRAALAMARGVGALPVIHPGLPTATFDELERPLGNLDQAVLTPISEFFEANVAATRYCGAGHSGWPIVDGFRSLLAAYAVSLWLLRWFANPGTLTREHAIEVVRTIDRSHDYPLLAGRRHRRRLALLARTGDLERLAIWYAR